MTIISILNESNKLEIYKLMIFLSIACFLFQNRSERFLRGDNNTLFCIALCEGESLAFNHIFIRIDLSIEL